MQKKFPLKKYLMEWVVLISHNLQKKKQFVNCAFQFSFRYSYLTAKILRVNFLQSFAVVEKETRLCARSHRFPSWFVHFHIIFPQEPTIIEKRIWIVRKYCDVFIVFPTLWFTHSFLLQLGKKPLAQYMNTTSKMERNEKGKALSF